MKFLLFFLLFYIGNFAFGAGPFGPSGQSNSRNIFYIELMGGGILPDMTYSGTPFDNFKTKPELTHTEGIGMRFQSTKAFSIGLMFSYANQGVMIPEAGNYALNTGSLNLNIPFEYGLALGKSKRKANPVFLLFVGPYASKALKSSLSIGKETIQNDLINPYPYDFGAELGMGIRIPTFSVQGKSDLSIKVAYDKGFINNFPDGIAELTELEQEKMLLVPFGQRTNKGIKVTLTYAFSLQAPSNNSFVAGGDGKKTYKRFLNIHN